ncbi:MAG TPA: tRNA (guanosine(37)-N1)-methyltransferase TrmD [Candidatus Pacearchaeota archaeon]|jgi:tRNA (guanine37-N1)-methyltransferase|nr:tRNA (guanosine(37)-N1)-methyltransferase TrmD [Candidatus Pacearchaeota archaeon]HQI74745.1 tRNA (guanosine(37)-N1)-methyltransferase TrmD [Candidatus Pacearchaeota archaeon]
MINFDIITIFPDIFDSYFRESIMWRAQNRKFAKMNIHNLRIWTKDAHRSVDDRPFSGGAGMIFKVEPIYRAVKEIKLKNKKDKTKVVVFSASGKKFNQSMAREFAKLDRIIMICPRYEGVDHRVIKNIADYEISIGDYVLTGGELPAMIVADAVVRLIPGVIKEESLKNESFNEKSGKKILEHPQFTRPEIFEADYKLKGKVEKLDKKTKWKVPKVLLSGNHKEIEEWKEKNSKTL